MKRSRRKVLRDGSVAILEVSGVGFSSAEFVRAATGEAIKRDNTARAKGGLDTALMSLSPGCRTLTLVALATNTEGAQRFRNGEPESLCGFSRRKN